MTGAFVECGHLGGYRAGGDGATSYPALWSWLVDVLGVRSVLDIGCGDRIALRGSMGDNVGYFLGIEGVPQDDNQIVQHDYAQGAYEPFVFPDNDDGMWDLAWCCEFVEHVEEQFVPNFLHTFRSARLVLMTHAEPGQAGYHHVNCQPRSYWVRRLAGAGFVLDAGLTETTRALAALNRSPYNHYVRSGLAFRRA